MDKSASIWGDHSLESNPSDKSAAERTAVFALLPTRGDDLNLDTGEVFQNISYTGAEKLGKKLIYATMTVRPGKGDEDYSHSSMSYIDEYKNEFAYEFHPAAYFLMFASRPGLSENLLKIQNQNRYRRKFGWGLRGPRFLELGMSRRR